MVRPNAAAMAGNVTSSWVGPTPPDVKTQRNRSDSARTLRAMSSRSSGMTSIRPTATPRSRSCRTR